MHFLGIDWKDKKPYFTYRENLGQLQRSFLQIRSGETFSIEVKDKKQCTGYRDEKTYEDNLCTEQKLVWKKDQHQCYECRNHETVHFFSLAGLSSKQADILRKKPHYNYINLFGNDIVKVGVATEGNRWRRILEQGADSTLFFTQADGITAREIENFVSRNFQIKQAVTYIQKIKLLKELIPEVESKAKLMTTYFQIKLSIPEDYKKYLIDIPQFSYNDKYFGFQEINTINKIEFIEDIEAGNVFSGEIIGHPGQLLIYRNEDKYYALNSNKIKGFIVDISAKLKTNKVSAPPKKIEFEKGVSGSLDLF